MMMLWQSGSLVGGEGHSQTTHGSIAVECESHHSPGNFVDSTGRSVFSILTGGGLWARDQGAVKYMTLHLWAANLKEILLAHSCIAFTACRMPMVSREFPSKQLINKECSEDVPGNTWGQLIHLQSKTCRSQDTTSRNTFLWIEFVSVVPILTRICWLLIKIGKAVCFRGQPYEGLGWYIAL